MNNIVSKFKLVEEYRKGEDVKCPECGEKLNHLGNRENTKSIYCEKCNFKIIVD